MPDPANMLAKGGRISSFRWGAPHQAPRDGAGL